MSEEAFVRLSRRAFQHFLWKEPREKSRWEAWIDLIQSAAYAPETVLIKGRRLSLVRGELVASVRYLAERWGWDKNKVSRFLDLLRSETMIETRIDAGVNVVRLCKYEHYNPPRDTGGTRNGTLMQTDTGQRRDSDGTNPRREEEKEITLSHPTDSEPPRGRPGEHPTLAQFQAECAKYSVPEWYAEEKWNNFAARGWRSGATLVVWREAVRSWVVRDYSNDGRPLKRPAAANLGPRKQTTYELTSKPNNGF